ncbi:hypothetical protein CALCODRAFT_206013 [Calocera cornea HHB12733]|uniref:MYND-type domain-containing protein n=1 Tax=Calocera cornea HHB12733 TaxID=1353952 RepID=A0A165K190_9BASI|nr:hypothetical protein CALCODRAFT_206013 [Calocera cornea HHB12733]
MRAESVPMRSPENYRSLGLGGIAMKKWCVAHATPLSTTAMAPAGTIFTSAALLNNNMTCNTCAVQFQREGPARTCRRCVAVHATPGVPWQMLYCGFGPEEGSGIRQVADLMTSLKQQCKDNSRMAISRLCALYLPYLVRLFLRLEKRLEVRHEDPVLFPGHVVMELLEYVHGDLFFNKYFFSDREAFPEVYFVAKGLASYLLHMKELWDAIGESLFTAMKQKDFDTKYHELIRRITQTSRILLFILETQFERETVWQNLAKHVPPLLDALGEWYHTFPLHDNYQGTLRALENLLRGEEKAVRRAKNFIALHVTCCAYPGCRQHRGQLHQCARCKAAVYCGRLHQVGHWNHRDEPHRAVCYVTTF